MYRSSRQYKPRSSGYNNLQRSPGPLSRNLTARRRLFRAQGGRIRLIFVLIVCAIISSSVYKYSTDHEKNAILSSTVEEDSSDGRGSSVMVVKKPTSKLEPDDTNIDRDHDNHDDNVIMKKGTRHNADTFGSIKTIEVDPDPTTPEQLEESERLEQALGQDQGQDSSNANNSSKFDKCSFRTYQPYKYYQVDQTNEPFLKDAKYIRGKLPFVINPRSTDNNIDSKNGPSSMPKKLCIDTSSWENVQPNHRPFSDGQNPSFVSLNPNAYGVQSGDDGDHSRIHKYTIEPIAQIYGHEQMSNLYLGLLLFGSSQCKWEMSPAEVKTNNLSPLEEPPQKRSMVVILNENLDPIGQVPLELEQDKTWGEKRVKVPRKRNANGDGYQRTIVELDDARLFFHGGRLHVLYRNGPSFGYNKQVQNPVHFKAIGNDKFEAFIRSSETFTVCCGRNIAFISELPSASAPTSALTNTSFEANDSSKPTDLFALTWIDPVTANLVTHPNAMMKPSKVGRRRLTSTDIVDAETLLNGRRRLGGQDEKESSSIHGTNGYLLPLHSSNELLGVAHFHRPERRGNSKFARHGHHYTHAFFTIQRKNTTENDKTSKFALKRVSNEFVFMAPSSPNDSTADVIQFASGLDLLGSDETGKLMISYGINDCEAAMVFIEMEEIQKLLIPVDEGDEVLHLMKKI